VGERNEKNSTGTRGGECGTIVTVYHCDRQCGVIDSEGQ
jgi:hypothetical protein